MAERPRPAGNTKLLGLSALSASSMAAALLSYFRFAETTAIFGANWRTDALVVATVFPFLVQEVVAHSFGSAFIPIYSRVMEERGRAGAVAFVNKTLSWLLLISSALVAVLWIFSDQLVRVISPSGSPELLELASALFRILLPMIILKTTNGILANFIKYERRFTTLAVTGVIGLSLSLLLLVVVRDSIGIRILPLSMLAGALIEFGYILYQSFRSGYKVDPSIAADPHVGQLGRMAMPVVGGTLVGFFGPIADKMLASFLPESSVTAIDYANRIKNIALAVIFQPLLTFADLSFSIEAAKGNEEALLSNLRKNMNLTSLILFPTAALLTVLAVPVVSVFFQRGNFTGDDARYMGYALAFYAPWLAQFGIGSLVSRAFYAQKDSATPVIIGIIGIICNVLLNLILIGPLGIGGLALATTVTSTGKTVYLIWSLSRKMGGLNLRLIIGEQFRILLANAFLVVGALLLIRFWPFSTESDIVTRFLQLAAYSSIGVLFMLVFLRVSGSSTFREISSRIAEKVRGRISR
ncbi:MAG TPA: lipid II flippase MurJ [Candidatus Sabulitectum sp.]|nr:lipid II flippase MurJ [Candidatus Sabulitectum sp.]HPF32598.1 lipid II flippase MurJ [Candidatus Sabulitectum sp.]HPJ27502.1 lipid II flippase MurJ [Candidatus Sabulitectum sp.]HPR21273.1 lipid II flippase MurJ [Candidatus Sabulitectum sp.]